MWTLNFDLREFDGVWAWLHTVPAGPERSRALAAATLVAVAELERRDHTVEGMAAFDEAIAAFPEDDRLPLWKAFIVFLDARASGDVARTNAALQGVRDTSQKYKGFTLFGLTLGIGGWEAASTEQIAEAREAFEEVIRDTAKLQHATGGLELERSRRIWDTPIAPYNIPAMQAMIGDLAMRAGDPNAASIAYFTALRSNAGPRWPWRDEVQRRMEHSAEVMADFAARPARISALGSQDQGAMGITSPQLDTRFGGRIGNGSCTVCHTHVSVFDEQGAAAAVGWVRGRVKKSAQIPNLQPLALLLPDGENPIPAGFSIGPFVDTTEGREFMLRDELYDGTFMIPAAPGRWFVATQTTFEGKTWQGYLPNALGAQWFLDVKAGEVLDVTDVEIEMKPLP